MNVKYPRIGVRLPCEGDNAVILITRVRVALRRANIPPEEIEVFTTEALSGSCGNVLQTCKRWVDMA